jgi:hypothetical protein
MLEALICFFPLKENAAGVGALDYSSEERKRLAIQSHKFVCDKCGSVEGLIPLVPGRFPEKKLLKKTKKKLCFYSSPSKERVAKRGRKS